MGLENQIGHLPKFQKLHIYSISTSWVKIELIFTLRAAVSKIGANFQNCHIWAWNLAPDNRSRSCTYTLLSTPGGRNWAYFCSTDSSFRDSEFSKLPYLGHETWPLAKVPEVAYILPFYPRGGWNWAYFCSMGSGFWDMDRFSKLLYIPRWKLATDIKIQKLHILFPPQGVEIGPIFTLQTAVSEILADFQNCHTKYLGMKLGHWPKFQKLHIYSLSTLVGQNWAYFRSTGSSFRDTGPLSKLPYLGVKPGHWPKCQKLHACLPLGVEIELIFALRAAVSEIRADFQNCHIWAWNLAIGQKFQNLYHPHTLSILPPSPKFHSVLHSTAGHFQDIGNVSFSHWPQC